MEVTHTFREAFQAARNTSSSATSRGLSHPHNNGTGGESTQRLADAILSVQVLIDKSLATCHRRVRAALEAMDECSPFVLNCEKNLLLSEAELATADASSKALADALDAARAARNATAQSTVITRDSNNWLHQAFANTGRGKALSAAAASDRTHATLLADQLAHFDAQLAVLTGRLSQTQLQLALCKEELALYKRERFSFGRCGILSCSDPSVDARSGSSAPQPLTATSPTTHADARGFPNSGKPHKVPGFGFVTEVSTRTMNTVDEMIRKTGFTVKEAGARAAESKLGAAALSTLRAVEGDLFADRKRDAWRGGARDAPAPHYDFTEDERAVLQQQNADLQQQQREASAQEAKAIETSVRELAQLTTLMNEKVVEQSEQFSILLKNTDAAHRNVKKALDEVQKPKSSFWNSTRQLIALLWICTGFLIVANWWIR